MSGGCLVDLGQLMSAICLCQAVAILLQLLLLCTPEAFQVPAPWRNSVLGLLAEEKFCNAVVLVVSMLRPTGL